MPTQDEIQKEANDNLVAFVARIEAGEDAYSLLEADPNATKDQLTKKCRRLAKLYHADKFETQSEEIQAKAKIAILKLNNIKQAIENGTINQASHVVLSETDLAQFQDFSKKILKVVNAAKDIPIFTLNNCVMIGIASNNHNYHATAQNLNSEEMLYFTSILQGINKMILGDIIDSNPTALGRESVRMDFSPTHTRFSNCSAEFDFSAVKYILESSKDYGNDIDALLDQYKRALDITIYCSEKHNKYKEWHMDPVFEDGMVKIKVDWNWTKSHGKKYMRDMREFHNVLGLEDKPEGSFTADISYIQSKLDAINTTSHKLAQIRLDNDGVVNYLLTNPDLYKHIEQNNIAETREALKKFTSKGHTIAAIASAVQSKGYSTHDEKGYLRYPLILGLSKGINLEMTRFLVEEAGFDLGYLSKAYFEESRTTLDIAAMYCDRNVVEYLYNKLERSGDLQEIVGHSRDGLLSNAIYNIRSKAPLQERDKKNNNRLLSVIEFLIEKGYSPDTPNHEGKTPLDSLDDQNIKDKILAMQTKWQQKKRQASLNEAQNLQPSTEQPSSSFGLPPIGFLKPPVVARKDPRTTTSSKEEKLPDINIRRPMPATADKGTSRYSKLDKSADQRNSGAKK